MVKEEQDFTVFSGNKIILSVSVVKDDGTPVDLTPFSDIKWAMANRPNSTPILSKSLSNGITVTDPQSGIFIVNLSSQDLASRSGSFYHEAVLVDNSTQSYTILVGTMRIRQSIFDR